MSRQGLGEDQDYYIFVEYDDDGNKREITRLPKGTSAPIIPPPSKAEQVLGWIVCSICAIGVGLLIAWLVHDAFQPEPEYACMEYHVEQQNRMRFYGGNVWMPVTVDVNVCDVWAIVTPEPKLETN